jgi:ECF sigma factor
MRESVVDHARRRHARKRGGDPTLLGLGVSTQAENKVVAVLAWTKR